MIAPDAFVPPFLGLIPPDLSSQNLPNNLSVQVETVTFAFVIGLNGFGAGYPVPFDKFVMYSFVSIMNCSVSVQGVSASVKPVNPSTFTGTLYTPVAQTITLALAFYGV